MFDVAIRTTGQMTVPHYPPIVVPLVRLEFTAHAQRPHLLSNPDPSLMPSIPQPNP